MDLSPKLISLLNDIGLDKRRSPAMVILPAIGVFAAGALIGGALGLLFAPDSGKKTRDEVLSRLRERFNLNDENRRDSNASA